MTQPLDRNASISALGDVDRAAGEVWVDNPFLMPSQGINLSAFERNRMFLNLDGRSFVDASFTSAADIESDSRGVVAADFDRDGAPDLLVLSVGGGPLRLFLNRFPGSAKRTRVQLIGTASNRAAIGARVVAEAGGRSIVRDLFPHNGGFGQAPVELTLGLGRAERIERLTVRWPTGRTQSFEGLPADATVILTEGSDEVGLAGLTVPADVGESTARTNKN